MNAYENLEKLNHRHKEIMRRMLKGERKKDIAEALDMPYASLCSMVNAPLFKKELERVESVIDKNFAVAKFGSQGGKSAREILTDVSPEAAFGLIELMQSSQSEAIKQKSCLEILNRTGVGPQEAEARPSITINISSSQVDFARKAKDEFVSSKVETTEAINGQEN